MYCSSTGWAFLILTAGFALSLFLLLQSSAQFANATNNFQPFDMQSTLSVDDVDTQLTFYTNESKQIYFGFFIIDFFFPLLGGLFSASLATFSLRSLNFSWFNTLQASQWLLLFLSPTLFDWLENISTLFLLQTYPPVNFDVVFIMLFFKSAKLICLFIFQTLAFLFLIMAVIKFGMNVFRTYLKNTMSL